MLVKEVAVQKQALFGIGSYILNHPQIPLVSNRQVQDISGAGQTNAYINEKKKKHHRWGERRTP